MASPAPSSHLGDPMASSLDWYSTLGSMASHLLDCSTAASHSLESRWVSFFSNTTSPQLTLTIIGFLMHELVYFGRWIPFLVADHVPSLRRYKLQPEKDLTSEQWRKLWVLLLRNHFLVELPMIALFHPGAHLLGMELYAGFPTLPQLLMQLFVCLFLEDMTHYFLHRLLHWGPLYRGIHKVHHDFSAPVGLAAEYAHPAEVMILGIATFMGPLVLTTTGIIGSFHVVTMLVWVAVRLLQTIDAHSGYDFPWSLRHILPFWAGADHHDYHHQMFVGNYATSFTWWDRLFGTDQAYRRYRARQRAKRQSQNREVVQPGNKVE